MVEFLTLPLQRGLRLTALGALLGLALPCPGQSHELTEFAGSGDYTVVGETPGIVPLGTTVCPSGTSIPNFRFQMADCGNNTAVTLFWSAPTGADMYTQYEVLRSVLYTDYCAAPSSVSGVPFTIVATVGNSRTFTVFS